MTPHTVEEHFTNKPATVRETYDALLAALERFGPVQQEPKKTSIHLVNRTGFAGVHPRRNYFNLEFKSAAPIEHERIQKSEQISKNRYHHTVRLDAPTDVDEELLAWLQDSYLLSQ